MCVALDVYEESEADLVTEQRPLRSPRSTKSRSPDGSGSSKARGDNAHFKFNHTITWKETYKFLFIHFFVLFYIRFYVCLHDHMTYIIALHMHPIRIIDWLSCTLYMCLSCYNIFICKYILGYVMKMDLWTPNCTWRRQADGGAQVS